MMNTKNVVSKPSKYVLGGASFFTKKAVTDRCRAIAANYAEGAAVTDPDDHAFLLGLLALHPGAATKIGCGVLRFGVWCPPPYFSNRGFRLRRTDGSVVDFSYLECVSPSDAWDHYLKACRNATAEQVLAFRRDAFARGPVACALNGRALAPDDCHVDHDAVAGMAFDAIARAFAPGEAWRKYAIAEAEGALSKRFADPLDESRFAEFHGRHAKLRMLSPEANLSAAAKPRRKGAP